MQKEHDVENLKLFFFLTSPKVISPIILEYWQY